MIETFLTLAVGVATYYSDGLMQEVYTNRLVYGQVRPCPQCVGFVALNEARYLGAHIWLDWPCYGISGPYLVVDCAQTEHLAARVAAGRVVEVSRSVAKQLRMRGPVSGVRVLRAIRADAHLAFEHLRLGSFARKIVALNKVGSRNPELELRPARLIKR